MGILNIQWQRLTPIIIVIVFSASLLIRLPSFFDGSFAYTYDIGRDLLVLSDITQTYKPPLIGPTSGLQGLFYGPWWYYITLVPFIISSGDPRGVLLFMILTGVATVWLGYVVGKKVDGIFLGILFSSLLAVSPVLTGTSKQIWNPNIAPLILACILVVFASLYQTIYESKIKEHTTKRKLLFFSLGLLLTLSIDAEVIYGSVLFISSLFFCLLFLRKRVRIFDITLFFLGVLFILLPRIFFEFRHDFLMTHSVFQFLSGGSGESFSFSMISNLESRSHSLFDLWKRSVAFNNTIVGILLACFTLFSSIFFYKKFSTKEKFFLWYSYIVLAGYLIILSFFQQDIWEHYLVGIPVIYLLLLSLSINIVRKQFSKELAVSLGVLLVFLNGYEVVSHFPKPSDTGDASYYRNHLAVVDFIFTHADGEPFNTITYTPPVHDYTYRYLFKWYGQQEYGYVPSSKNVEAFYVIVEPDYELPERRGQWIRDRSVDGVNIREENFDGDIIVQIRKH